MNRPSGRSARSVAAIRAGIGLLMLVRPSAAARLVGAPPDGSHPVLRVLGTRHLLEAVAIAVRPSRSVVAAGLAVDATHVLSCLLLGAVSADRRRPALGDAALESGVLAATWLWMPEKA